MGFSLMKNFFYNFQPFSGLIEMLYNSPALHAGLFTFNPCLAVRQAFGISKTALFQRVQYNHIVQQIKILFTRVFLLTANNSFKLKT